jgi:hypothetical protein
VWDIATLAGTIGLFLMLIFIFVRILPAISIFELRELVHRKSPETAGNESAKETAAD